VPHLQHDVHAPAQPQLSHADSQESQPVHVQGVWTNVPTSKSLQGPQFSVLRIYSPGAAGSFPAPLCGIVVVKKEVIMATLDAKTLPGHFTAIRSK